MERAVAFAREVGQGVRKDFPDIFSQPDAWPEASRERDLLRRVHLMERLAHDTGAAMRAMPAEASVDALQKLEAFDLTTLADAASRAQQLADHLRRASAPAAAAEPRPEPRPAATQGPDVALIRGLAPRSATQKLGPAPGRPAAAPPRPGTGALRPGGIPRSPIPPRPGADAFTRGGAAAAADATGQGARRAFDQALKLAREVLAYVTPRLTLADVALEATGLPAARRPWPQIEPTLAPAAEQAGVAPQLRPWLPILAQTFLADAEATRKTHQAVTQWKQARQLNQQADKVDGLLAQSALVSHAALLRSVDNARLRAAVYPLSHLHIHFRGVPHMSTLFPPPP